MKLYGSYFRVVRDTHVLTGGSREHQLADQLLVTSCQLPDQLQLGTTAASPAASPAPAPCPA